MTKWPSVTFDHAQSRIQSLKGNERDNFDAVIRCVNIPDFEFIGHVTDFEANFEVNSLLVSAMCG